ncbi:MAG: hypothetical protein Q9170_007473 [Blastenia crenularia]
MADSLEINMAWLFYQRMESESFDYRNILPQLPAAGLSEYGNVGPVKFRQGDIIIASKARGKSATLELLKGCYTVESLQMEKSLIDHQSAKEVVALTIVVKVFSECYCTGRGVKARSFPLAMFATTMKSIRLELDKGRHNWKGLGRIKKDIFGHQSPDDILDQLKLLRLGSPPNNTAQPVVKAESPQSRVTNASTNRASPKPSAPTPQGATPSSSATLSSSVNYQTSQASSDRLHLSSGPTSLQPATPLVSTNKKRTRAEIDAQYDELEKEEEEFVARSRERKKQLREELKRNLDFAGYWSI